MATWTIFVLLGLFASLSSASECEERYNGARCVSMFPNQCQAGNAYTYNFCGFLQQCCIPPGSVHTSGTTPSPSTSAPSCGTRYTSFSRHKIAGGTLASVGEFPWQVSLRYNGQHVCGGTLIGDQWVLSAAHCFHSLSTFVYTIAVGINDKSYVPSTNVYRVSRIIRHAQYNDNTKENDITLIRLSKAVPMSNYQRKACLPSGSDDYDGSVCTVSGWGATYFAEHGAPTTRYMRKVDIPIMSNSLCAYYTQAHIFPSNVCAGVPQGGKDSCQGDSGGPLVCLKNGVWNLVGVVSYGYGCGATYRPGVYTRVSSFRNWISTQQSLYG
ncbi:hypothetical protein ScPMuIL_003014 [Solemya velum]